MNFTAPCGHPGEAIIGTFVRCLKGCDSLTKAAPVSARRTPGHVEMCACKMCQIRRSVSTIVLRSKDGDDVAKVPWDGNKDKVSFKVDKTAKLRHWSMLDAQGAEVASGMCDYSVIPGGITIDIQLFMDKHVKLSFESGRPTGTRATRTAAWPDIRNAAYTVGGVQRVEIRGTDSTPGSFNVTVTKYSGPLNEVQLRQAVEVEVHRAAPAGSYWVVQIETPTVVMMRALKEVEKYVRFVHYGRPKTQATISEINAQCLSTTYSALKIKFGIELADTLKVEWADTGYSTRYTVRITEDTTHYYAAMELS
jgi:hypothetical protein